MNEEYELQLELHKWISSVVSCELKNEDRNLLALLCFDTCIDHQLAILVLFKNKLFGSMFALIRSCFESCILGNFLLLAATPEEIEKYKNDKLDLNFKEKISRIEGAMNFENSPLSTLKSNHWKIFNSFTHTGYQQLARRYSEEGIISNYPEDEIKSIMSLAGSFALLSATSIVGMSGNKENIELAIDKCKTYAKLYKL